jgi:hypothetical protein
VSLELKRFLLNACRPYVDERVRDIANDYAFRVNDAKDSEGASFCHIYVTINGMDRFLLHLANVPTNFEMAQLVASKGGEIFGDDQHDYIRVPLETADFEFILKLSEAIRNIFRPERRASDKGHVTICMRAADSLHWFSGLMRQYEAQTRGIEKTRPDGLFAF